MNAVAGLLRGRSIILKITRARNSIKFSKIHSSRGLAARSCGLARTRTRPHEWRRAGRRFEGHDIGYFYPGLGANGILHQITRPSLRNLNQTFFRTTGIRREMNKTRYNLHFTTSETYIPLSTSFHCLKISKCWLVSFHHLMETIHFFQQSTLLL